MAELAKSFITVSDESAYGAGVNLALPLYVIATESNKVLDSTTGEIAPGTTIANELMVMTSQRDVINTFGIPYFEEVNGTVQQGSELNEVGLLGLYSAMGSVSNGYVVRADIDLKQLKPSMVEPKEKPANGTKWLDTSVCSFGVFRNNGKESSIDIKNWDYVNVESVEYVKKSEGEDIQWIEGDNRDIVFCEEDLSFYECFVDSWEKIGTNEWKAKVGDENVDFTFAPHTEVPSEKVQGSIWIKTTQPNDGSKYVLKTYNATIDAWNSRIIPMYRSYVDAESALSNSLRDGTIFILCDSEVATISLHEWNKVEGPTFIKSNTAISNPDNRLTGYYVLSMNELDNNGDNKEGYQNCQDLTPAEIADKFNREIRNKYGLNLSAAFTPIEGQYYFNIESTDGMSMRIEGNTLLLSMNIYTRVGEELLPYKEVISPSWKEPTVKISSEEPSEDAKDGTLWFNNAWKFDILVNTGATWKGISDAYTGANLYVTSEEPKDATDMSIWVDTNAEFPTIYRQEGGSWELMDNSDQTTSNGVLFADARYYDDNNNPLTYEVDEDGIVSGTVMKTSELDSDAPEAKSYPKDMLLFNTRFSTNNVKVFKKDAVHSITKYVNGEEKEILPGGTTARWVTASGNDYNGAGLFGSKAQRKMVVDALSGAVNSCEELRSINYDFFYACCPGYPEVDVALSNLNSDKKEIFYIVSDSPKTLKPTVRAITDWGTNANNANHGLDGRVLRSAYMTRQYPPMGMASNVDGTSVAIPTSIAKMKNLLNLPTGQICAGSQYGVVSNIGSTGYITEEGEYATVSVNTGIGEAVTAQAMNPIMTRRNTGLLFWGENTENNGNTSLSDEHGVLSILRLKRELDIACTPFFFRKNTESTRADFDFMLRSILNSYITNEEFYDYVLDTETPNTAETISRKELHANIAIEIVKGIEFIYIPIRVVNTGTLSSSASV